MPELVGEGDGPRGLAHQPWALREAQGHIHSCHQALCNPVLKRTVVPLHPLGKSLVPAGGLARSSLIRLQDPPQEPIFIPKSPPSMSWCSQPGTLEARNRCVAALRGTKVGDELPAVGVPPGSPPPCRLQGSHPWGGAPAGLPR